jgi:hypothetical protein
VVECSFFRTKKTLKIGFVNQNIIHKFADRFRIYFLDCKTRETEAIKRVKSKRHPKLLFLQNRISEILIK